MINWRDIRHREFKKSSYDGDTPQLFSQNGNSKFSTKRNPVLGVLKIVCFHSFAKFRRGTEENEHPLQKARLHCESKRVSEYQGTHTREQRAAGNASVTACTLLHT